MRHAMDTALVSLSDWSDQSLTTTCASISENLPPNANP